MKGDTTMRKFIVCALVALTAVSAFAAKEKTLADSVRVRDQHHNVMVNLGAGLNTMVYKIDNGNTRLGGGMQLQGQYQYMFNENWGIGAGIGFSTLKSRAILNNMVIAGQSSTDNANQAYVPYFKINEGWKEIQNMISIDIPVQAFYRYPINDKWALQAGLGLTLNFPAWMGNNVKYGTAVKTADFSESMGGNMVLGGDIKRHGLGDYTVENLKGGIVHKAANIGMQADFGGLYNITELLDLYFGLYLDAQFISCQKQTAETVLDPNRNTYTSVMNTALVKKGVNPLEFGAKVGVRIGMRDKKAEAQEVERILTERLDAYKSAELSEVGREAGLEDGTASKEVQAIYEKYAEAIANASSKEEVDALIAQAKEEIALQQNKEAAIATVQSNVSEEDSDEVRAIAAAYAEAIRNASSAEEVEALKAAALKAMQDQRDKEEADRQTAQSGLGKIVDANNVTFEFKSDKPIFNEEAIEGVKTVAAFMEQYPTKNLILVGHTDTSGDENYNVILGLRRAEAYRAELVKYGVQEDRVICLSKGSEQPIASNDTREGRAANRRVEMSFETKTDFAEQK